MPPRIAEVGGAEGGQEWMLGEAEAIEAIEQGRIEFYVILGGSAREVVVAGDGDLRYLKTTADHHDPNDLLALGRCRRAARRS